MAAAVVVVITISRVLEVRPPAIGPAMLAYRPYTGFTPISTAEAIPSGTLLIAPGNPATTSLPKFLRSGFIERPQARTPLSRARPLRVSAVCLGSVIAHRSVALLPRLARPTGAGLVTAAKHVVAGVHGHQL